MLEDDREQRGMRGQLCRSRPGPSFLGQMPVRGEFSKCEYGVCVRRGIVLNALFYLPFKCESECFSFVIVAFHGWYLGIGIHTYSLYLCPRVVHVAISSFLPHIPISHGSRKFTVTGAHTLDYSTDIEVTGGA